MAVSLEIRGLLFWWVSSLQYSSLQVRRPLLVKGLPSCSARCGAFLRRVGSNPRREALQAPISVGLSVIEEDR
jgi:hypothetical protein